jgi:AcrR family transcriptional regulator
MNEALKSSGRPDARERILSAAYDLFARQGTRAVGVDAIIERSGVAKMTLYRHFKSKQDLVLAFLERRQARWTVGWLAKTVLARAQDPRGRLLAIFDTFHEWFQEDEFEGCSFVNVLLEYESGNTVRAAAAGYLMNIRSLLREHANAAGLKDVPAFCDTWHMLMKGSIIAAMEGNRNAAMQARSAGAIIFDAWAKVD